MTSRTVPTNCTWCKRIVYRDTVKDEPLYYACSPECQKKLSKVFQSKEWKKMTPFEQRMRKHWVKDWYENIEREKAEKVKNYMVSNKPVPKHLLKSKEIIIQAHGKAFAEKGDPEFLTADFIKELSGNSYRRCSRI